MKYAICLTLFILSIITNGTKVYADIVKDSIETDSAGNDSLLVKVIYYMQQAEANSEKEPADAVKNYRSALITTPVRDELWEAGVRLKMAKLLNRLKNKEVTAQLLKAESLYKKYPVSDGQASAMTLLAKIYEQNGQFAEALKKYNDLYKVHIDLGEAVPAGAVASHVSDLFIKKKNYKEAFNYADKAKKAYDLVCRRDSLGAVYLKIAQIKRKENKIKLAEYYVVNKALPFFSSADDFKGRIRSFDFLARMYRDMKKYSQAKWFYLQANTQSRSISDTVNTITSLLNLSVLKTITGDLTQARQDLTEAELLSKATRFEYLTTGYKAKYRTLFKKLDQEKAEKVVSVVL